LEAERCQGSSAPRRLGWICTVTRLSAGADAASSRGVEGWTLKAAAEAAGVKVLRARRWSDRNRGILIRLSLRGRVPVEYAEADRTCPMITTPALRRSPGTTFRRT